MLHQYLNIRRISIVISYCTVLLIAFGFSSIASTRQTNKLLTLSPGLSQELILRTVHKDLRGIKFCYNKGLAVNPDLRGRVLVKFEISLDGTVQRPSIAESTLGASEVGKCVLQRIAQLNFPRPTSRPVTVFYPFVFLTAENAEGDPGNSLLSQNVDSFDGAITPPVNGSQGASISHELSPEDQSGLPGGDYIEDTTSVAIKLVSAADHPSRPLRQSNAALALLVVIVLAAVFLVVCCNN